MATTSPPRSSTTSRAAPRSHWAWSVGHVAGIELRIHATFLILLAWVGLSHVFAGHGVREALAGIAFVATVFAIVVLHELGHALAARHFGIATHDITLLPIGGISRLDRMPSDPRQELLVAVAGPAVNVGLAAVLFALLVVLGSPPEPSTLAVVGGPFIAKLLWTNIGLAVFNLIPAFPMDGGRVLRAALSLRMDPVRATDIAARVGQAAAILFGLLGLFVNPILVFIALFVWIGAQEEAAAAHVKADLAGVCVGQAMVTRFTTMAPDQPIGRAAQLIVNGFQDDFPIVDGSRLVGWLTREAVLQAAFVDRLPDIRVASVMQTGIPTLREDELLGHALELMQSSERRSIPVLRGDELVGVLPLQNVAYLLQLRELARAHAAPACEGMAGAIREPPRWPSPDGRAAHG